MCPFPISLQGNSIWIIVYTFIIVLSTCNMLFYKILNSICFNVNFQVNGVNCDNGQSPPAANFKKPMQRVSGARSSGRGALSGGATKRKGCRCGNATATPGKLTCCGQRCPCYVESKACIECRCRGCRNPHRPGGRKVCKISVCFSVSGSSPKVKIFKHIVVVDHF